MATRPRRQQPAGDQAPDFSGFAARLHEQGFRVTPQRQLILRTVSEGGHCTPEDVYRGVRARAPGIDRATVYRTLNFLCELRVVVACDIGGGRRVYELAGEQPHHHLVCRTCGRVEQIDHTALRGLFRRLDREKHFLIDMDHVALFGLCPRCRRAGRRRAHSDRGLAGQAHSG